ncbi:hypothetical protein PG614_00740 [Riemerella anatipestifer]|nr:hypothetical protein [Riemerella anatipestifer]MDY3533490.1 hypothetical protein [Riemerella anatipestifer]MDY3534475.1 hypothetical protein [Riemerella anatipestifer]
MKTKMTKLSVLAFLGLGLAVYGQSGKVGVNISSPRATLDVQPNATNSQDDAKTNEGILAPKLSKIRVASIEAPVEGTLVYVIDDASKTNGAISNYTGNDTKVAKITEKGYYYYNGTEWVKPNNATNDIIWGKEGNDARLVYPNTYIRKYLSNGGALSYKENNQTYTSWLTDPRQAYTFDINNISAFNKSLTTSSDVPPHNDKSFGFKIKDFSIFKIDQDIETQIATNSLNQTMVEGATMKDKSLYGIFTNTEHWGTSKMREVNGIYASGALNGLSSSATRAVGGLFDAVSNSDVATEDLYGSLSRVRIYGTGNISRVIGSRAEIVLRGGSFSPSSNIGKIIGQYIGYNGLSNTRYTGKIGEAYDIYAEEGDAIEDSKITKRYGVYINGNKKTNFIGGNLGIGMNTPTEKLEVAGNVKATGFIGANASIFPDYVFQKYYTGTSSLKADYNFKTLSQVEDFVKTNGHLPGYLSASKIKEQGYIDLMATQLTNVEKIEELYLHLLEKDKEVKALKERLEKLEKLLQK